MRFALWNLSAALLLALASLSAQAATAWVGAHVETVFNRLTLGPGNTSCSTNNILRECNQLIDEPLLAGDPDGVWVSSELYHDVFLPGNVSAVPNMVFTGNAIARARPGSLHASAEVKLVGTGGGPPGISAYGYVEIDDQIKVRSSTLADGTAVTLSALLDITGLGPGSISLNVRGSRNGIFPWLVFGDSDNASGTPRRLEDIGGSFTAFIGETLYVNYALRASTGVSTAGWQQIDVQNGRAAASTYGNSAYLYFSSADPAVDVFIEGESGYDYVQPPPVPEPETVLLMLSGLGVVGFAALKRRRNLRSCAADSADQR
jgi:hypothetical protein